ncbi:rod-binding protein [Aestuariispira ectoiniformans]|uniref:rod-binding protein n=1 Tax=Aestuariispira ectoiniformans TaxID=2775080 RepID=UPI00223B1289|nr:rod-binding protein [Aestuariispira ectoiniformans]
MDATLTAQMDQALQSTFQNKTPDLGKIKSEKAAHEAAVNFEAMFLTQMVEQMFSGVKTEDGYFGGGSGEKMFRSMLSQEYGHEMAKSGGIGIADMVQKEILKIQEEASQ